MELRPGRGADVCGDRKTNSRLTFAHRSRWTDLEPEPVSNVAASRSSEVCLGDFRLLRPVHVDIDGRPHAQITRKQGRGTFKDPSVVDQVEPLKQAVIGHLPLQLHQRPLALPCQRTQPVGEGTTERRRTRVAAVGGHNGRIPAREWPSDFSASASHSAACGSPISSRSQRSVARPSPLRSPSREAYGASLWANVPG